MNAQPEQGPRGACVTCPFNDGLTDEASQAQSYGCLPSRAEIVLMKRESGQNWACHGDESKVCSGLCHSAKSEKLDLSTGGLVRYSSWYHAGEAGALEEARTGYLVQKQTGQRFDQSSAHPGPTHRLPSLKYFFARTGLEARQRKEDTRVFLSASTAPGLDAELGSTLRSYVALLEIETSPTDADEVWLKYLSVAPAHQRKGLAMQLLRLCVEHVRETGQRLALSSYSDEGREKLQAAVTRELTSSGIRWSQGIR